MSRGDLRSPEKRIDLIGRPQDAPTKLICILKCELLLTGLMT